MSDLTKLSNYTHIGIMLFAVILTAIFKLYINDAGVTAEEQYHKWKGEEFLAEKAKQPDVYSLSTGLKFKILNKGNGVVCPDLDTNVEIHYEGALINGTVFDSSYARNLPLSGFTPAQGIAGWMQSLQMMREGDTWELYVPEKLGYGAIGIPNAVPPYAAMVFKIELLKILTPSSTETDGAKQATAKKGRKGYREAPKPFAEIDKTVFIPAFGRPYELL